ncbi:unnamed protein product [Phytophthora lilii]|uniref:Unnamed protein product n=1 Tax=Phytophthora lilii TaxID=2077276 RepID=A0A9W6XTK1_9STRA|nr:unnamed protein product [Phytophthora lilii]
MAVRKPTPWNTRLWLTYEDSFNIQWDEGQPSATEKYAKVFGLDVKTFMDGVSSQSGVDSFFNASTVCTSDADCDASFCGIRTNATSGYCIAPWYGFSHAWAPAALNEKEPRCPVTFNGVTFQPMDLEGLITAVYSAANISTVFTGHRFNGDDYSVDQYGRILDPTYRDLNPGFAHIAAANMLGRLNTPFIIDGNTDYPVWNIAVGRFEVYNQTAMTPAEAAQKFYAVDSYPFNDAAKGIFHVLSRLSWGNETFAYSNGTLADPSLNANQNSGEDYELLVVSEWEARC